MAKNSSKKHQRLYRMKGCSKKTKTCKNYLGGSGDINLAYPATDVKFAPNPFLAYTGKGGALEDKALPNQGPPPGGFNFINYQGNQRGGGCGCGLPFMNGGCGSCGTSVMNGGTCASCTLPFMSGGNNHRSGCKCSVCKGKQSGGNPGIPYPNGLAGSPWTPAISGWPGVDGVQGGRNYLAPNNYHTDISRQMIDVGANPPFTIGGKRGQKSKKTKKQRGGTMSNFFTQDLINLGRQFQFGMGSAYNALSGYGAPTNPMPWKDQLPNTPSLSTMRASSL